MTFPDLLAPVNHGGTRKAKSKRARSFCLFKQSYDCLATEWEKWARNYLGEFKNPVAAITMSSDR